MSCVDNEGHSPLDWAADAGDVNMIEYLIRKGEIISFTCLNDSHGEC